MKISILLLTYNRCALLNRCLASILSQQTRRTFDVFVCDDNSSDPRVAALLATYANLFQLRGASYRQFNSGVSDAERPVRVRTSVLFNRMSPQADGDVLWYMADDNEIVPDSIDVIASFFEANPNARCGYVGQVIRDADYKTGAYTSDSVATRATGAYNTPLTQAFCQVDMSQVVVRKDCAPRWAEDGEHWHHADGFTFDGMLKEHGPLYPVNDVLAHPLTIYKVTDSSLCRQPVEQALAKLRENV